MKRMIDADELAKRIKAVWWRNPHEQAAVYQILAKIGNMIKEKQDDTR